jgi:gliding motility-associated-like protein
MSRSSVKIIYNRYFQRLLLTVIFFLLFLSQQSHAQCSSVSIYDRIVSGYHSTLAVKTDGNIAYWGENMGQAQQHVYIPTNFSKSGFTPIMGTIGGGGGSDPYTNPYDQAIFLTNDGLYAVGKVGGVLPPASTPSPNLGNLGKISTPTGGNSYGLPIGINNDDVASIFATYKTLLIVTKNDRLNVNRYGQVWIITQTSKAVEANGEAAGNVASSSWKQVMVEVGIPLTNITAARGQVSPIPPFPSTQYYSAFMALAANGDVFTWGNSTYLGDNFSTVAKSYATKMTLPSEFSSSNIPKMIGVTGGTKNVINSTTAYAKNTYFLLSNSGSLYTLGDNSKKQCGDFTTSERTSWVNVKSSNSTNFTNINSISVQEHTGGIPCASAITMDGKLYTWGEEDGGMLGRSNPSFSPTTNTFNPGIANGSVGSTAVFAEMGGHTLMYIKVGSDRFCYIGHKSGGSMGDGDFSSDFVQSFDCTNTPQISICGSVPVAPVTNSSVISALPTSIVANGTSTSTITVQLKNSSNVNLTTSGGVGVITTSLGTISSTVDNNDGTYTAILTSPISSGTATLGFNLSGITSSSTATVEFTPMVAPLTPGSINGSTSSCPTTAGLTYSVSPVANAATYIWVVPTGWTITAGQGTYSITVTAGSFGQNGNISVSASNIIGTSGLSTLAVTVSLPNTITLSSASLSDAQTVCINTAISSITYSTTFATGATVTNLPTGLNYSWTNNLLTISGTPSVAGSAQTYTINLTGGCGVITTTGTIAVTANNTVARTSAAGTDAQVVCINTAIVPITYSTTGATGATVSNLPTGLSGIWANNLITISGTPTVAVSVLTYTIELTGGCGVVTTTGTITVSANNTAARSSAVATATQTVCINSAISTITYATTGATGANVSNLPSGVTSSWLNNILTISGTPTFAGSAQTYTVNLTGGCGVFTTTGTIEVTANNTVTRTSAAATVAQTVCINSAITSITYSTTGATGASFIGLPAGVTGQWSNNVITISGTPTVSVAAQSYTVTLTGGCGVITTTGTISVTANNTVTRTSAAGTDAQSVCINTAITPITYSTVGATGAVVSNLPSGITSSWSNSVLTISGTPTVVGTALTYIITLSGGCGVVTTTGTIAVKPSNTITLSSLAGTDNQLKCINTSITNINYNTTGATGANFIGLPVGVSGIWSNNAIVLSGSPSISGTFNYAISLIGGCLITDKPGSINVSPENTITLSSTATTDSQSICIGKDISTIEYTTLGATGFTITGLPTGLQAVFQSNKIKITGTPSVTGVFNYTISLAGGCGMVNKNGTVIINSLPTGTIAASNNGVICEGSTVALTATGGNTYEWSLNGNLIPGVSADSYSASIAGLYSVKLISDKGCINSVQQTVTLVLNNAPVVGYSFDKYCINTPIIFTNSSVTNLSGPVTMLWEFGDNEISSSESPTHTFLVEKTYAVKLTITPTNCPLIAKSLSKNIKIEVPPLAVRYPNIYAVKNTNTKLTARSIGKTYTWIPSTGLSNAATISPNFNFTAATNYVIKITNDAGCILNDSLNVLIFDQADFLVPKAFSPNNDGRNDKLLFAAPGIESFQYLRIFNRWGNLVFETNNLSVFWDGSFKGLPQPAEVYSWFAEGISKSGNKIQRNGQTLILR